MNQNIDIEIYNCRSENFINTDEFDKAAVNYKRLIAMNRKSYKDHYMWALIIRDEDKYRSAELKFRELIILDPQNHQTHLAFNNLGNVQTKQGKYEEAISSYKKGLKLSEDHLDLTHNLAICYTEKGDYEEAIELYEKALKQSPDDVSTHNCMGYLYFLQGKYKEAISKFDDAIQKDYQYATSYCNKAMSLFCLSGIGEESKNTFESGIKVLAGGNDQKLCKLKDEETLYSTEKNRIRKELESSKLGFEVRENLERIEKGLEYILDLLGSEVANLEKLLKGSPS